MLAEGPHTAHSVGLILIDRQRPLRVVVLGGNGNFGARVIRALDGDPDIELESAGRRPRPIPAADAVRCVTLDVGAADFKKRLAALSPGLVIHCVGPFQGQSYGVPLAALSVGAHYLDLADGRDFVAGFAAANDGVARAADRLAISGASTLPALSSAVIDALREPLKSINRVEVAIAPGQAAPRGAATLEAVFSYLGRPFSVWRERHWQTAWGWMDLRRVRFDIGQRWAAACDVPDLALFPRRYPDLSEVSFHAALEFGLQHLGLWLLAALRRIGLPLPVQRAAIRLNRMAVFFDRWAGSSGGMRVSVEGQRVDGKPVCRTWHLTTPAIDGPEIACMAAVLLARRIARGSVTQRGAYPCMGFLGLSEFEPEFANWKMRSRIEEVLL